MLVVDQFGNGTNLHIDSYLYQVKPGVIRTSFLRHFANTLFISKLEESNQRWQGFISTLSGSPGSYQQQHNMQARQTP
jgi:hypothetical protein